MPFGLSTAPATFQRTMEIALSGLTYSTRLCYLDDVIVYGRDVKEHNLRVKLSKCIFAAAEVTYLSHVISRSGIKPNPRKISAVRDIPPPQSVTDVRSFLGLAGYYRKSIPDFATVVAPLVRLTQKNTLFNWTDECESSFNRLKGLLCSARILSYPKFDREFLLQTDA